MNTIFVKKLEQEQKFLDNGARIPVTRLEIQENIVTETKTSEKHSYSAIQLGFIKTQKSAKKSSKNPQFKFLREVRLQDSETAPSVGNVIKASEILSIGDIVDATGVSKGKGYAGGVKRHGFRGGPKTHGQSDRERAPGAIGTGTTPGRILKGKKMAGRMGHARATVRNLKVMFVNEHHILIKGLVPGGRNTLIMLKKTGEDKKFVPLYSEKSANTEAPKETETQKQENKVEEGKNNAS
jgi:large subunit ribosomal protein L3